MFAKLFIECGHVVFMLRATPKDGICLRHIKTDHDAQLPRDCAGIVPPGLYVRNTNPVDAFLLENWDMLLAESIPEEPRPIPRYGI